VIHRLTRVGLKRNKNMSSAFTKPPKADPVNLWIDTLSPAQQETSQALRRSSEAKLQTTLNLILNLLREYLKTECPEPLTRWLGKRLLMNAAPDPKEAAYARGEQVKRELIAEEGGCWSAAEVAEYLGLTRQGVDKRRAQGKILAITHHKRGYLYPKWQFDVPGIELVFTALSDEDDWTKMLFMLGKTPRFEGKSPLQKLREGHLTEILQFAQQWGETAAT